MGIAFPLELSGKDTSYINLRSVVNDVLIGFDSNSCTILILLDLSAAFDTVDIDKLLSILDIEYGIRGTALKWFRSLCKQHVRICNSVS